MFYHLNCTVNHKSNIKTGFNEVNAKETLMQVTSLEIFLGYKVREIGLSLGILLHILTHVQHGTPPVSINDNYILLNILKIVY